MIIQLVAWYTPWIAYNDFSHITFLWDKIERQQQGAEQHLFGFLFVDFDISFSADIGSMKHIVLNQ